MEDSKVRFPLMRRIEVSGARHALLVMHIEILRGDIDNRLASVSDNTLWNALRLQHLWLNRPSIFTTTEETSEIGAVYLAFERDCLQH